MIRITDSQIRNLASNSEIYEEGCKLVDKVHDFTYDKKKNVLYGVVGGPYGYDTYVELSQGSVAGYGCQCENLFGFRGACEHVVALLEAAKDELDKKSKPANNNVFLTFSFMESPGKRKEKKVRLWLEHDLFSNGREGVYLNLRLKAGDIKPYTVKNIPAFLNAIEEEKNMYFTKKFELDFGRVYFEGVDKRIIEFLTDLIKEEEKYNRYIRPYNLYYSNELSIFYRDSVKLFEQNLKRYLEIVKGTTFTVNYTGNQSREVKIAENLDIDIKIEEKDGNLLMQADYSKDVRIMGLTDDFEVVFDPHAAVIYKIPGPKRKLLESIHRARLDKLKPVFKIERDEQVGFFNNFIPKLEDTCKIDINPELQQKLIDRILVAKVYFDIAKNGISARVDFCYGDRVINYGDTGVNDDIILRDFESEDRVIRFLDSAALIPKDGLFLSENEEDIVELLSGKIEELKELAEVYYSESFKSIQIRNVSRVQMGIRLSSGSNLLEFDFQVDEFDEDELLSVLSSVKEKKKYYRLKSGSIIKLDNRELLDLSELFRDLDIDEKKLKGSMVNLPSNRALFIDNFINEREIKGVKTNENFEKLVREILNPAELKFELDEKLKGVLRDYQKFGFRWMKTLAHYGFGGILADDMGLGKTLQVLSFIKSERETSQKPNLVVAPTSLVYNWKAEVEKFVPELRVNVISGTKAERMKQLEDLDRCDIAVTSYGSLKRDIDMYEDREFSYVFVDEAQQIKNPATLNAGSVKRIRSKGCFALTGTPIENTLTELWSIFDFIMPGYLLSHNKFVSKFESPIVKYNDKDALKALSRYIKPFLLRRVKQDVLKELPEKIESKLIADMTGEQKKLYAAYLKKAQGEIALEIKENGLEKSKIKILALLTRLRQLCCHPATFIDGYKGGSGKMDILMEVMQESIGSNHRILLFSQFTSMLGIIENELKKIKIPYFYLDGSTKAEDRIDMVNRFNQLEKPVFLISLKAGGTGLNLTAADVVIHFDPWWNPSVEDQATDRAHRIGQTKAVQVFRIVARGTIEERIIELQSKKKGLINSVIKTGENLLTKLSEKEIREIFQMP
jgi:SNF2 family DNA or RNA helicase